MVVSGSEMEASAMAKWLMACGGARKRERVERECESSSKEGEEGSLYFNIWF